MAASSCSPPDILMEERHGEQMIRPTGGGKPTQRSVHFLNPATLQPPPPPPPSSKFITISDSKKIRSLFYRCHRPSTEKWKTWVDRLKPIYQQIWNQAGIYHSILSSTQKIPKDSILIMGLAERWCVESNTFIFSWGESTLTLEDMSVLGGYFVLGDSVLCPLMSVEAIGIRSNLDAFHKESRQIAPEVSPTKLGWTISWTPVTNSSTRHFLSTGCLGEVSAAPLSAPLQLVLIWAWKRFCGEPRLGRQKETRIWDVVNVREALDSAQECFLWRPYVLDSSNFMFSNLNKENGGWVSVESDIGEELESYARCLRVSKLVGLDCIEQYLPNRVAMQFGFDQDIPGHVTRSNGSYTDAWSNYNMPIRVVKLYVPPRLFESDVTMPYLKWYKGSTTIEYSFKGVESTRNKRSTNQRTIRGGSWGGKLDATLLVLPASMATSDKEEGWVCVDHVDKMSINELVHCKSKINTSADVKCDGAESVKRPKFPSASSSVASDVDFEHGKLVMEPINISDDDKDSWDGTTFNLREKELDVRVSRLERVVAALKEAKREGRLRKVS